MKQILIVDDNAENIYMLVTLLKGNGMIPSTAKNGQEALDMAHLNPPDLIVTDILMPVMDGYTLCRLWKTDEKLKKIPFVFYTATYTESKDETFAINLGADRFVLKPQDPSVLMDIIKEMLEKGYSAKQVPPKPLGEEMEIFRQYNEILFKKLEKKMMDLEVMNQELKRSEELYRLSFENASDVILTLDKELQILSMSPSLKRILGYQPNDFIHRPFSTFQSILTPDSYDQAQEDLKEILLGKTTTTSIYRFVSKDGDIKHLEVNGSAIRKDDLIIGMISVARDISERRLVEEKIRKLNEELEMRVQERTSKLEEVNKELESFAFSVSHDLRAPLRAINGFSNIIFEEYSSQFDNKMSEYINIINDNGKKMDKLITDLLKVSRTALIEMNYSKINMMKLIDSIFQEYSEQDKIKKVLIEIEDLPDAFGDPTLIQQVWINLITNAIKYSEPKMNPTLKIGSFCKDNQTVYFIKDNGVGFNPNFKSKLYGVFQRLHKSDEFEGTGIGLAIVKRIIQRHGGKVWADGEEGAGATFYFSLPIPKGT